MELERVGGKHYGGMVAEGGDCGGVQERVSTELYVWEKSTESKC
jgi:hypothetical protein